MRPEQWLYRIPLLLRSLFRRHDVDHELDEEIRYHIEQQTELNIAAGMSQDEARRAAMQSFGNVDARKEECHDHWVVAAIDHLRRDLRLALRRLSHEPVFTLGVIVLLALGIGANVAVFSIVNSILLKPLDYTDPDRLMIVREVVPEQGDRTRSVNVRHYLEWKQCECFEDIALSEYPQRLNLAGDGDPIRITALRVTPNAFSVLGASAQLGRTFVPEDARPGQATNVVISDRIWRNQFGADPDIIDRIVDIDSMTFNVIGVLPPGFRYHPLGNLAIDAYAPWPLDTLPPWFGWTNNYSYAAVARLAEGVSPQAALAATNAIQAGIAEKHFTGDAASLSLHAELTPLHTWVTTNSRSSLYLLLAAVGVALLVACFNIANLMLVRATARAREAGIRTALGATRTAIFRGVFVESAILAVAGTAIGVVLAWLGLLLTDVAASSLPRAPEISLDMTAMLVAAGLSVAVTILFGLLPAMRLTRIDTERALEAGGRSSTATASSMHGRQVLVCAEVSLSVTLMIVAGLLLASFVRLDGVERGFDSTNVLTAEISLPTARYTEQEDRLNFWNALRERLLSAPGVQAAGFTSVLPLRGNFWGSTVIREGESPPAHEHPSVQYRFISEGYLNAVGVPVLQGRHLNLDDYRRNSAVISVSTARLLWGERNPLGRRFHWNDPNDLFEVVGVVPDVHSLNLETDPTPIVYRPLTATGGGFFVLNYASVAMRMAGDPITGATVLRDAIAAIDPGLAVSNVQTMQQIESASVGERRMQLYLVGAFGVASLLIAALGTYSVLAYAVSTRRHELALRMALGAGRGKVLALVLRQGMYPVLIGIFLGIFTAIAFGSLLASLLFQVEPTDTMTLVAVIAATLIAAFLASFLPARRAAGTPLLTALRYE